MRSPARPIAIDLGNAQQGGSGRKVRRLAGAPACAPPARASTGRPRTRSYSPPEGDRGLAESASRTAAAAGEALREQRARRADRSPGHSADPAAAPESSPIEAAEGRSRRARGIDQRVVILSGLSGAGKTSATKLFEDLGYTCMDNLPGELLPALAELVSEDRLRFEKWPSFWTFEPGTRRWPWPRCAERWRVAASSRAWSSSRRATRC